MRRSLLSFVSRFDESGARWAEEKLFVEAVWIDRDYYVQVYADQDETVQTGDEAGAETGGCSLTARRRRNGCSTYLKER